MPEQNALQQRLGLLSGGLTGLALAAGIWGQDALSLWRAHAPLYYQTGLIGVVGVLAVCALAGWLAARAGHMLLAAVSWLAAVTLVMLIAGHVPYEGRTLLAWLSDRRFWGLPLFPFEATAQTRLVVGSLLPVLMLTALGLVQDYRLEGIQGSLNRGRLTGRTWLLLLLPMPLVVGAGLAADNIINIPLRDPLAQVSQIIDVGGSYRGDLDALSQQTGLHYSAIVAVQAQLSGPYRLTLGEVDLADDSTVVVVADFDHGAWIHCLVSLDRVSFCHDALAAYSQGMQMLLAGQDVSQCQECQMQVSADWQAWLRDHGRRVGAAQITRLGQQGGYVLMRAANPASSYAVRCLFSGNRIVNLVECQEE